MIVGVLHRLYILYEASYMPAYPLYYHRFYLSITLIN